MRRFFVIYVLFLLSLSFSIQLFATKVATLPELMKPKFLEMDNEQIYIVEGANIYIYSKVNFKLKKKFGEAGEGPKEFKISGDAGVMVFPQKDYLVINSIGKVSFYTKDGNLIKELKVTRGRQSQGFYQPIGNFIAGLGMDAGERQTMSLTISLFDSKFNKIKDIYKKKLVDRGKLSFPITLPVFMVRNNRIIVGGNQDFIINIFNENGEKEASIFREYKKLEVTKGYKQEIFDYFKNNPRTRASFSRFKQMAKFQDYFPAIQYFFADKNKIYIMTYKKQNNKYEFFIYDMSPKFLKKVFLPVSYINPFTSSPWTINDDTFYQLLENDDTEEWELHSTPVK